MDSLDLITIAMCSPSFFRIAGRLPHPCTLQRCSCPCGDVLRRVHPVPVYGGARTDTGYTVTAAVTRPGPCVKARTSCPGAARSSPPHEVSVTSSLRTACIISALNASSSNRLQRIEGYRECRSADSSKNGTVLLGNGIFNVQAASANPLTI